MEYNHLGCEVTSLGLIMVVNHHVCWDISPMTLLRKSTQLDSCWDWGCFIGDKQLMWIYKPGWPGFFDQHLMGLQSNSVVAQ